MKGTVIVVMVAAAIAIMVWLMVLGLMVLEEQAWEAFRREHHCVEIGEVSSSIGITTAINSTNGQLTAGTTYIPGKKGYRCDDGKAYWR